MCGIIGVLNHKRQASLDAYFGLLALQPRGKESAGMVTEHNGEQSFEGGLGELPQAFLIPREPALRQALADAIAEGNMNAVVRSMYPSSVQSLEGTCAVAHVRYGTAGVSGSCNIQPMRGVWRGKPFALAHNGNLTNARLLRAEAGVPEQFSDTRIITDLIARSRAPTFDRALSETFERLQGAFSIAALYDGALYAARDRFGIHPLQIGRRDEDWFIASESCAFDTIGAWLYRDIGPGELVRIDRSGIGVERWSRECEPRFDIFEFIYLLQPPSVIHGVEVGDARNRMGRSLAEEHPVNADLILPVPDSGNEAARGYWQRMRELGHDIDFHPWALYRPHTVSRTFIEPVAEERERYLRIKFNPRPAQLRGKRVVLVDDSLVRGNTARVIVQLMREAGAIVEAFLVASPPYRHKDFLGIDTYRVESELIARKFSGSGDDIGRAVAQELGLPRVGYLSLERTIEAVCRASRGMFSPHEFYAGPFTGEYPTGLGDFEDSATAPL